MAQMQRPLWVAQAQEQQRMQAVLAELLAQLTPAQRHQLQALPEQQQVRFHGTWEWIVSSTSIIQVGLWELSAHGASPTAGILWAACRAATAAATPDGCRGSRAAPAAEPGSAGAVFVP